MTEVCHRVMHLDRGAFRRTPPFASSPVGRTALRLLAMLFKRQRRVILAGQIAVHRPSDRQRQHVPRAHIRRNTTLRLFAGISVTVGTENPMDGAIAQKTSTSRRPQVGLRSRRFRSNASLLWAVANPLRL